MKLDFSQGGWDMAYAPKKRPRVPGEVGVIGHYQVDEDDDGTWTAYFDSVYLFEDLVPIGDPCPTREAAEAAAQADYDERQKEPVW